jgi:hypothetical protein
VVLGSGFVLGGNAVGGRGAVSRLLLAVRDMAIDRRDVGNMVSVSLVRVDKQGGSRR